MKKWIIGLIIAIYLGISAAAWAEPQVPLTPTGSIYVQDYAGVLSGETKAKINKLGAKIAGQTKAQVVVVTMNSLNDESIEDYSLALLRQWKIGDKALNNGVLLLVAIGDRKSRIEVGYGLEGALNDAKVGQIQDEYLLSYFERGEYDQGIWNGYKAIMREVSAEYGFAVPKDANSAVKGSGTTGVQSWWNGLPWWLQAIIVAGFFLLFVVDWLFFGGSITFLILSLLRFRNGGSGGYGGGSSGGGGADRKW